MDLKEYKFTLNWYVKNKPEDFAGLSKLIALRAKTQAEEGATAAVYTPVALTPTVVQDLLGKEVCLVIGHEPGGGAKGERTWNIKVANQLALNLEARGAVVFIYFHKTRSYNTRCYEMRAGVKKHMPNADFVLLMHYNSMDGPEYSGHHFQYRGAKSAAEFLRDAWQEDFPWSEADRDNGIYRNTNAAGSLMLRLAPAWAVLTEPGFESNPEFRAKLITPTEGPALVAACYARGIGKFLLTL